MTEQAFDIKRLVNEALSKRIEVIREEVITDAAKEFNRRVRDSVGTVALALLDAYSVERMGTELLIRVKITDEKPR